MVPNDFDRRLSDVIARVAEDIPNDTDLWPAVRQRAMASTERIRALPKRQPWRAINTAVAVLVVVALAVGALAIFHNAPAHGSTGGQIVPINTTIVVAGVQLTVRDAYADATRTIVTYSTPFDRDPSPAARPLYDTVLLDAQGQVYTMLGVGGSGSKDTHINLFTTIYAPLPADALSHTQHLIFRVKQVNYPPATDGPTTHVVKGPWDVAFTITPAAAHAFALKSAPLTLNGITIQPVRVDWVAPETESLSLDGNADVARLELHLSGLPPAALLDHAINFGLLQQPTGSALMTLTLSDGTVLHAMFSNPLHPTLRFGVDLADNLDVTQPIGGDGSIDVELMFLGYRHQTSGTAQLRISGVDIAYLTPTATSDHIVLGPWTFTIPVG